MYDLPRLFGSSSGNESLLGGENGGCDGWFGQEWSCMQQWRWFPLISKFSLSQFDEREGRGVMVETGGR